MNVALGLNLQNSPQNLSVTIFWRILLHTDMIMKGWKVNSLNKLVMMGVIMLGLEAATRGVL